MHSIEQQIYASLALEGVRPGHHTHAASPGLSAQAIERHEDICNRWGSYEPGADFNRALVQVPLRLDEPEPADPSHFVVILITFQGRDAGGRPGAMLRHIVRIPAALYQELDYDPFHLQRQRKLLEVWTPDTPFPVLENLHDPSAIEDLQAIFPERYPLLRAMLSHCLSAERLHLPTSSDSPAVEESLAELIELTPISVRRRLSLATFATKHVSDFKVAGVRQEGASFRRTLEQIQTAPAPELTSQARQYVDDLFTALETKDWTRALALVRETDFAVASFEPTPPGEVEDASAAASDESAPEAAPAGGESSGALRVDVGPPPPEMPYRRYSEREPRRSSRGRLLGLLVLVVVLAVGGFLLVRSQRSSSGRNGESGAQLQRLAADNLETFVADHEHLLSDLLANGRRDFDLQEDMAAALVSWPERASRALQGETAVTQSALSHVSADSVGLGGVATALMGLAKRVEQSARQGETLHRWMTAGSVEALRRSVDPQSQSLTLAPARGDVEDPTMSQALAWGEALQLSATGMARWNEASADRDPDAWTKAAQALDAAMRAFPPTMNAPLLVQAASGAAAAMVDLLHAERPAAARSWALAMPYSTSPWQDGELGDASARLRTTLARMRKELAGLVLPVPVAVIDRFYGTLTDAVAPTLGGAPGGGGAALLRELAPLCASEHVCEVRSYAVHVARWKLEAWRRLDGPESAEGKALLADLGDAALPEPGAGGLQRVLPLMDRMERASVPAPHELVREVQTTRGALKRGFYADLLDVWLQKQQRGSRARQAEFRQVYDQVKSALSALRDAADGDASSAYHRLRTAVAGLGTVDLRQAAAAGESQRVAAARALEKAIDEAADVTVDRLDVHLLTETDYAGTRRAVAKLTVTVSRVDDGKATDLLAVTAPPMLSAPGVGFDAVTVDVGRSMAIKPQDRLLVSGRDEDGTLWFHYYVDPPAQGHVASALNTTQDVEIAPARAREIAAAGGLVPPPAGGGEKVARVHFVLSPRWWAAVIAKLPELP